MSGNYVGSWVDLFGELKTAAQNALNWVGDKVESIGKEGWKDALTWSGRESALSGQSNSNFDEFFVHQNGMSWTPRAHGGRGYKGFPYIVGDDAQRRPELYIPDTNGTFVNGDSTERILNNINNSRTVGNVTIYVTSTALSVDDLADELGDAVNRKLRMSGAVI